MYCNVCAKSFESFTLVFCPYCGGRLTSAKQHAQEETVAACFACPVCHEAHTDQLEWNRDGTEVVCLSCGSVYDPNA